MSQMKYNIILTILDGIRLTYWLIVRAITRTKTARIRYRPLFQNDNGNSSIIAFLLLICIVIVLGAVIAISFMDFTDNLSSYSR